MPLQDRLTHAFDTGQIEPPAGPTLVISAEVTPGLLELNTPKTESSFRPAFSALEDAGFDVSEQVSGNFPSALVNLSRSREESLGNIARAWSMLDQGGMLLIDGAKTDGIDAIHKTLRKHIDIDHVIPKAHGKLISATKSDASLPAWQDALNLRQNKDGFHTTAGIFSADSIDEGSQLLARHFPNRLKGSVADLGAGWGWLSHAALAACEAIEDIHLIEAEARALAAARANLTHDSAYFHWADATEHSGKYDAVITNPPFHADRKPDPSLGLSFISAAAKMLKPNGKLMLVANRMLPYEDALEQLFRRVERREQTNRFKVFEAGKPR